MQSRGRWPYSAGQKATPIYSCSSPASPSRCSAAGRPHRRPAAAAAAANHARGTSFCSVKSVAAAEASVKSRLPSSPAHASMCTSSYSSSSPPYIFCNEDAGPRKKEGEYRSGAGNQKQPSEQLKKPKSRSVASCCSNNKEEWITAQMSRVRHVWTDEEHNRLVELMKNPEMVQHYKNDKGHFFEIVIDAINGLDSNQYSGYVLLDELSVEDKLGNFLSNMKTHHKLEEPSTFTLSREETSSYCAGEVTSSRQRKKKKTAVVPTVITDKQSALQYLENSGVIEDEDLVDYSYVLEEKSLLDVFKVMGTFAEKIVFLKKMVEKRERFDCVLNQEDFLGIP